MRRFLELLRAIPLVLISPLLAALSWISLCLTDLCWYCFGRPTPDHAVQPDRKSASIVIPNWNGRDLLQKYLPSVVAATELVAGSEIIVVDNGSTDGSADFVRTNFPGVRLLELPVNLGFGGGSNAGFAAAQNDIVVLLNSDMRVDPGFLQPLLDGFTDEKVFAVSCQIFLSDPERIREETGLTQAWWAAGSLRVRHRIDDGIDRCYPCFYGGGGSCAFDRRKFTELGGFDSLLAPFYLEDTDLGYMAWKRGWKVLYQPRSIVFHEHRGTIGKKFSPSYIDSVLKKNFLLFSWKNIHEPRRLAGHFLFTTSAACLSLFAGPSPERASVAGQWRAFCQLLAAMRSRWQSRSLSVVTDTEALLRPMGGYFRDRFETLSLDPRKLSVVFLSPYPICPPVHGGGVFMYQTIRELAPRCALHLISLLDFPSELEAQQELREICTSTEFVVRMKGQRGGAFSHLPHAVMEFANPDLEWLIHRQIYLKEADVLQLEYTNMGQYAGRFRQIACILFEHDIYFQSIRRALAHTPSPFKRVQAFYEYLRAFRFELQMLPRLDRIQVCSSANGRYLESFLPGLNAKIDDELRAGINTRDYCFQPANRQPETILFLGSFRHLPNREAVDWFVRHVLPRILALRPTARLVLVGSDPPPRHSLGGPEHAIELRGFVEDIQAPLRECSLFVCPILSGSGMRVKLLEAFACGIPVVSTRLGAEGLANNDGDLCFLADEPESFAARVVEILTNPAAALDMVVRARHHVEEHRDMTVMTARLEQSYRAAVSVKRRAVKP